MNATTLKLFAAVLLFALPMLSQAQELHPIDEQLNTCIETAPNNSELVGCALTAYKQWDEVIDEEYKKLSNSLPDGLRAKLENSQAAWIAYREHEFEFNNDFFAGLNGTAWNVSSADWKMSFTRNRALELMTYNDILNGTED